MGSDMLVYSAFLHHGEEPPISGTNGSGTIFFSGCSLKCVFCQNYRFSHNREGRIVEKKDLARVMLNLQKRGAHNINLVSPTHFLPQILDALLVAFQEGLTIPIVYNTSGYEHQDLIEILDAVIDIYLPDMKYLRRSSAQRYSDAAAYSLFNQKSIRLMYKQKKNIWEGDLLREGLIIRHLVIPGHIEESLQIISWIKENTPGALTSIMLQYQPYYGAEKYPEINRTLDYDEYEKIKAFVEKSGLTGWIQEYSPQEDLAGPYFSQTSLESLLERDS
jgi:putative pyruvate formate lyase activating enzyme